MSGETQNPMDRDYMPYGPGGLTNAEIWNRAADQMQAAHDADSARRSERWASLWSSGSDNSSVSAKAVTTDGSKFAGAVVWLVLGCAGTGFAIHSLDGEPEKIVGSLSAGVVLLSLLSIVWLVLKNLLQAVGRLLPQIIGIALVVGVIYLLTQGK